MATFGENPFDAFDAPSSSNTFDAFTTQPTEKPSRLKTVGEGAFEFGKSIAEGAVSSVGSALAGAPALDPRRPIFRQLEKYRQDFLRLNDMSVAERNALADRLQKEDPISRRLLFGKVKNLLDPATRAATEKELKDLTAPTPIKETTLFKTGKQIEEQAMADLGPSKGWENSFTTILGQGLGSVGTGIAASLLTGGAGSAALFTSMGAGQSVEQAVAFDEAERKNGRPGLKDEDIAMAGILGTGPGATDSLPIEFLLGRLKVPLSFRRPLARFVAKVGGQAAIEGIQEGGQQYLQNAIQREIEDEPNPETPTMAVAKPAGLVEAGNIDLTKRPVVKNADGSISTVRSISVGIDGKEVLLPTVSPDGRIMSNDQAIARYERTGEHLGIFDSEEHANTYAGQLHYQQDRFYNEPSLLDQVGINAGAGAGVGAVASAAEQLITALAGRHGRAPAPAASAPENVPEGAQPAETLYPEPAAGGAEAGANPFDAFEATPAANPAGTAASTGVNPPASAPVTDEQRAQLKKVGLTDAQINEMTPADVEKLSVQFKITDEQKGQLRKIGLTDEQIAEIKPADALKLLETPATPAAPQPAQEAPAPVPAIEQPPAAEVAPTVTPEVPANVFDAFETPAAPVKSEWEIIPPSDDSHGKLYQGKWRVTKRGSLTAKTFANEAEAQAYLDEKNKEPSGTVAEEAAQPEAAAPVEEVAKPVEAPPVEEPKAEAPAVPEEKPAPAQEVSTDQAVEEIRTDATKPAAEVPAFSEEAATAPARPDRSAGVYNFDPLDLRVDAQRFQFKTDTDQEGVNATLKDVKNWRAERGNQIIVWQDKAGKLFVADGHQRTGLARRLIEQGSEADIRIPGVLFRETDGLSAEDVMVIAALKNIAEGSSSPVDAARVLRATGQEALADLPLPKEAVRTAVDLSKLGDEPWRMVVNEVVEPNYAKYVGRFLASDQDRQVAAMKALKRADPSNEDEAAVLVRRVAASELAKGEAGAQTSMFGEEPDSTAVEEVKIVAGAVRQLRGDRRLFSRLVREADRIEATGSKIEKQAAGEVVSQADRLASVVETIAFRAGPVRDTLTTLAKEVKGGERSLAEARTAFVDALRREETQAGEDGAGARPVERPAVQEEGRTGPEVIDFEQFAAREGESKQGFGDAGLHSGAAHVSKRARKATMEVVAKSDAGLSARRDELRARYDAEVAAGRIRPLTSRERLEATATGDPDKESTQAAKRVLAKREAMKAEREKAEPEPRRLASSSEEPGAEGKPQLVLPGAEQVAKADLTKRQQAETVAQRQSREKIAPKVQQKGVSDTPLFGDEGAQKRLLSSLERPKAAPFFSAVVRSVENAKLTKGTPDQWLGYLRNQPGVKQDELDWLGVGDWLAGQGSVTKEALTDFVRANQVEVKEVAKGGRALSDDIEQWKQGQTTDLDDEGATTTALTLPGIAESGTGINIIHEANGKVSGYDVFFRGELVGEYTDLTFRDAVRILSDAMGEEVAGTKFSTYQLPGGSNYRELLLTLPPRANGDLPEGYTITEETPGRWAYRGPGISSQIFRTREAAVVDANRNAEHMQNAATFTSSHWDEPNVLAHVRFNEREVNGKRVLFLEEIQSDFGQAVRKERAKVTKAINDDFDGIAAKMVAAGIIQKECD